jgi:hypothetical protein
LSTRGCVAEVEEVVVLILSTGVYVSMVKFGYFWLLNR